MVFLDGNDPAFDPNLAGIDGGAGEYGACVDRNDVAH